MSLVLATNCLRIIVRTDMTSTHFASLIMAVPILSLLAMARIKHCKGARINYLYRKKKRDTRIVQHRLY